MEHPADVFNSVIEVLIKHNCELPAFSTLDRLIDISNAIEKLAKEGILVTMADIKAMSPYMTSHIKRFGEYIIDLESTPDPIHKIEIEKIIEPATL